MRRCLDKKAGPRERGRHAPVRERGLVSGENVFDHEITVYSFLATRSILTWTHKGARY